MVVSDQNSNHVGNFSLCEEVIDVLSHAGGEQAASIVLYIGYIDARGDITEIFLKRWTQRNLSGIQACMGFTRDLKDYPVEAI